MLHKIAIEQVELGMFVHALDGSWLQHDFWRTRFLITEPEQIRRLRDSDIEWVTIDDEKGGGPAPSRAPDAGHAQRVTPALPGVPGARPISRANPVQHSGRPKLSQRERAAEMRRAAGVLRRSKAAVTKLFSDARLGNAVKSRKMVPLVEQITASIDRDPAIILNIARLKTKDEYTFLHSVAVCALMINFARTLDLPEAQVQDIGMAGLLHDVGKMAIPDTILQKPGKLDDAEWAAVRTHPERGHKILSTSEGVSDVALEVCLRHHEKMDGTGYPGRIPGDQLSLVTRMSAICDVYDAVTSQRPYNTPWSASQALGKMQSWAGHFDQLLLRSFAESLGIVPVGALVRLNTDQLAVVTGESAADFTVPTVRVFRSIETGTPEPIADFDLGRERDRRVLAVEDPLDWGLADWPGLSAKLLVEQVAR